MLNSTDYSKFRGRSRRGRISELEKYFYSFLQRSIYEEFVSRYNPLESLLFMVSDLQHSEQQEIYDRLQEEILEEERRLHPEKEELRMEDVYRGAIEIVEHKHETAKFVIQSLNDKTEQFSKLQKLNEWRSSKFRQILISKNFLSFNDK